MSPFWATILKSLTKKGTYFNFTAKPDTAAEPENLTPPSDHDLYLDGVTPCDCSSATVARCGEECPTGSVDRFEILNGTIP